MRYPPAPTLRTVGNLAILLAICLALLPVVAETVRDPHIRHFLQAVGLVALWRYTWWGCHWVRALIFARLVYPAVQARAAALWWSGWRPPHLHVLITTFHERPETSRAVIAALCREVRDANVPATLWLGSSDAQDEEDFARHLHRAGRDLDITLRITRQNQPGKRVAIGLVLRAMSRAGLGGDDIVAFMDGDFVLHRGAVARCCSVLAADPHLEALTTDEHVLVEGPNWLQSWLDMRFAQRRIAMQSHALSGRVLTLTGRFSVFRARHITSHEFIRLVEADCLDHWLWGRFRFLSGDDKSTWYYLLAKGARMTYLPDAAGATIEVVEGSGVRRLGESLMRWSGNMLRNGARAIRLGPRRMPPFIWWCLVDQRLAIWTALFGPALALAGTLRFGADFLIASLAYVVLTRSLLALVLFTHAPRVDIHFVWTLYANQLLNAAVKVYLMWRLPLQRWANRGNQTADRRGGWLLSARETMAATLTVLCVSAFLLGVLVYSGTASMPATGFNQFRW